MNKTKEQIIADLDAKIPKDAVSSRQGGGTKALLYLEGWYVIDRMNKIFGPDAWSYDVTELRCVHQGELAGKYGTIHSASYSATVALFVQFPDATQAKRITDVGFGNGTDKTDPGKPHELATKEAVTDALKRCAKSLGMSLGLALYDKSQENVGDEPKGGVKSEAAIRYDIEQRAVAQAAKPAPTQTVAPKTNRPAVSDTVKSAVTAKLIDTLIEGAADDYVFKREALNKRITAMSKVVIAKRLKTLDELKADMKAKYGADNTAGLDDAEAKDLLANLEKMANGT